MLGDRSRPRIPLPKQWPSRVRLKQENDRLQLTPAVLFLEQVGAGLCCDALPASDSTGASRR